MRGGGLCCATVPENSEGGVAREPAAVVLADAIDAAAAASAACFCCSAAVTEVLLGTFDELPGTCAAAVMALYEEMLSMPAPEGDGEGDSHRSGAPSDSLNSSCNCCPALLVLEGALLSSPARAFVISSEVGTGSAPASRPGCTTPVARRLCAGEDTAAGSSACCCCSCCCGSAPGGLLLSVSPGATGCLPVEAEGSGARVAGGAAPSLELDASSEGFRCCCAG